MEFTTCCTVFCSVWATVLCGTPVVKQQGFSLALIVIVSLDIWGFGKSCNFLLGSLEEYKEFEWLSNALQLWVHQPEIGENCSRWFWASLCVFRHQFFIPLFSPETAGQQKLHKQMCIPDELFRCCNKNWAYWFAVFRGEKKKKKTRYYTTVAVVDPMPWARK